MKNDARRVAVIHGPNLNLLGSREPEMYGHTTLEQIDQRLEEVAVELGVTISSFQSNHEGQLVDYIQQLRGHCHGIVINAAGLTHTSVALRDALVAAEVPFVEVHLSNIHARESFRQVSLLASAALGVISGFGPFSYELGLRAVVVVEVDAARVDASPKRG